MRIAAIRFLGTSAHGRFRALLLAVLVGGAATLWSGEGVRAQETDSGIFGKEILGNEMNPSISLILDFTAAYFSQQDRVKLGGHNPSATGMELTGAELAASANVDPYFRFDMAFCFGHMHLEEFYMTTLALPGNLLARAGLFLSKAGRINNTHPHSWVMGLGTLPNMYLFGAEGLGGPGVELSWLIPLPWFSEITAAIQNGEGGSFRTKSFSKYEPGPDDFIHPIRLVNFFDLDDDWALQVGANAVLAPSTMGPEVGNRSSAYGIDIFLKYRPIGWGSTGNFFVSAALEGWFREMEVPQDVWRDAGGYADLTVGISKRWMVALRGELWKRIEGDEPDENNRRAELGLDSQRVSAALLFLPSHFSKMRLQYTLESVESFNLNHIVLMQLEVSAGSHGAHSY